MASSPEYPDLPWVPPRSWTNANRTSVQLIVIHTTEGSEGPASAEDGAAYDQRRTDGTSTHYFHDADSTVQCVRTEDQAHAARTQGNRRGIQHELCGRAGQSPAQWADAASQGTLRQAARQCARDARKWGIPVRHLTVSQVNTGAKGFCGHNDITRAFPADGGTHTDPGPDFPWSQFLDMVRAELEDMDMPTVADIVKGLLDEPITLPDGRKLPVRTLLAWSDAREIGTRKELLAAIAADDDVDEKTIVAGVLAGLSPAVLADAVVQAMAKEQAQAVADEISRRLEA